MFPAKFEYHRAQNLRQAIELLGQHAEAKLLAGGHSLIPMMKLRLAQPATVIDIGRIDELRGIRRDNGTIGIGALTTHAELASSGELRRHCRVLSEAAGKVADAQVRNRGTIGGNIAHADPASDIPAVLVALEATIELNGPNGERRVNAADFFVDLLTTDIRPQEVLTRICVPEQTSNSGSCYLKLEHSASGYAICGAAAVMLLNADGSCAKAKLCFNGVSSKPHTADVRVLSGTTPDDAAIDRATAAIEIAEPLSDLQASGSYRVELARVYGKRALKAARDRARC